MATAERALFVTRLGGILAAVGSAVGLGNVWRFPYETGAHGGAAFLLVYLGCVLLLGTPLMLAELSLGRATHLSPTAGLRRLAPSTRWYLLGYVGAGCMLLIVGFYGVVAGWTLCYTVGAALGRTPVFASFSTGVWGPLLWMSAFMAVNGLILLGGVRRGIERASNVLMPLLALMIVALCANSLLLPGADAGLRFLFHPDFSQIDGSVVVSAMGQSFFSISVGICCLMTYGSYLPNSTKMGQTSLTITLLDTLIAVLSGVIIFPACFAYGVRPDAGPGLAFITLPDVFGRMPGGAVWSFCFFLLLAVAALTSSLSMLETPIAILQDEARLSRRKAVVAVTALGWALGVVCALSLSARLGPTFTVGGFDLGPLSVGRMPVFDLFDRLTANVIMPTSALLMSLFVAWVVDQRIVRDTLSNFGRDSAWFYWPFRLLVGVFAPVCIVLIFLSGLGLLG